METYIIRDKNAGSNNVITEHLNIHRTIWYIIRILATIVGVSTYKKTEMNARLVFTSAVILVAFPSIFYTMVVVWPNIETLLEVVCIFGVLLPVCCEYTFSDNIKFNKLKHKVLLTTPF